MKTYANWKGNLGDYLKVGDEVDQEMVDYFLNVLPPATWRANLVQLGEPHSHVGGRATYPTLYREIGRWYYRGNCYRGEETQP